ncbi:hypothetical protein [Pseudooceanicola sp.]|uniref:hypothetical protein n=1 Tax=Pseudooceanicola sp. TaxID=1914328 RepID=UPI004058A9FD
MVKLVLLHKADSICEDEPVEARPRGYFAVAKIERVIPKPVAEGRFLAMIEPGTFLPFDREVPRLVEGRPMEAALTEPDGTPKKGGAGQLAVRRLPALQAIPRCLASYIAFGFCRNI